ncbi:MAG TPA: hypothetical protein VG937_06360 [Polyangiaceae bacterium]|nr:hypothetical protein [Polyangiaceae bacterium]
MMQCTWTPTASILGSLFALALGSACHVVVEKDDATGGQSTSSSGGSDAMGGASSSGGRQDSSSGGSALGGSALGGSAQGGSAQGGASVQGGSAVGGAAPGGSAPGGSAQGGNSSGAQAGTSYVETCGLPEPFDNNDRDTAVALGASVTLCLDNPSDEDWFYVDTPADGKAHVLELNFDQEPTAWTNVDIYSKTDGSNIDSFHLDKGVKSNVFVTLGPGSRTWIDISAYNASDASTTVKAALTTENDSYEPNNDRDTAAAIKSGQKVSAQMLTPYVAKQQAESADWFKVELTAGDHVFHLSGVPQETWLDLHISDSARVNVDAGHPPNRGAIFDFPFTVPTAGTYFFSIESYLSAPAVVSHGNKPHFLGESYTFQID